MTAAPAPPPRAAAQRRRRHRADRRLRLYGIAAISLAVGLLAVLVASLLVTGWSAFTQTKVRVDFPVSAALVDPADPGGGDFRAVTRQGIALLAPGGAPSPRRSTPSRRSSPAAPPSSSATPSSPTPR